MIETCLWKQPTALAKYGTLSEVANRLNLFQSVFSRSMKKIEHIMGVSLFTRKKNSIALNNNGILAAQYAEKILAFTIIDDLQNDSFNLVILHERPNNENFFSLKCGGEKLFIAVFFVMP